MNISCIAPVISNLFISSPLTMDYQAKEQLTSVLTLWNIFGLVADVLNQIFIFLVTMDMAIKCSQLKFQKTALHAHLCTIGFVCLTAEALTLRYNYNTLTYFMDPPSKLHLMLQFTGGVLGVAGTIQKSLGKKKHFTTKHGQFGLAACIFFVLNCLAAIMGVYGPSKFNNFLNNILGLCTFVSAMICQYYSYNTGFFSRNFEGKRSLYVYLTYAILFISLLGPFQILLHKVL